MSAIIARAPVPPHSRITEGDTARLPAVPTPDAVAVDAEDLAAAAYLLSVEKAINELRAAEYMAGVQATLDRLGPAITDHPQWEAECIPGDTPLHVSREFTVTVPSGLAGKTVEIGAQVQQGADGPADIWLTGGCGITVSVEHAEAFAATILAAAALARRVNEERAS